jgi:hypothetical protein
VSVSAYRCGNEVDDEQRKRDPDEPVQDDGLQEDAGRDVDDDRDRAENALFVLRPKAT